MKTIALIDYGSGNLHSAARALRVAANAAKKTREIKITADPDALRYADRIVLPGVGHFADCIENLRRQDGLIEALTEEVITGGKPFLGICVGLQLMASRGLEGDETSGLGWIPGTVKRITPANNEPVPHIGWNELVFDPGHPVLEGLGADPHVYFVHSYALSTDAPAHTLATTDYAGRVTACAGRDNLFGTQFHPEKSQEIGLKLLSNFVLWQP
ncbi:MAG: imidazole glycerol phosphate synthase subunit HisH [Pseudomonadota bacterium]